MSYPQFDPMAGVNPGMARSLEQGIGGAFSLNEDPSEDQKLPVRFFYDAVKNDAKSREAGRLITDRVEMYEIILPSGYGKHDVRRGEVSDKERQRFPRAYAAFARGADQAGAVGTPLRDWPVISTQPDIVAEATHIGLQTVEHMAALSDGTCQQLGPGWRDMRQKAKDWLENAKSGAVLNKLREEATEWRRRAEAADGLIQQLNDRIQALEGKAPMSVQQAPDIGALVREQVAAAMAAQAPKPVHRGWPKGKSRKKPADEAGGDPQ